ncbi:MAG: nucleotidyltransferase family protein [Alphaproteobacteria bacterium]|nr:MAG: hypothetical protein B6I23_01250 [Rickettsiaceae bacterium 4572_127]
MKKELAEKLKKINISMKKHGFIIEGFFGSHARGDAKKTSDLDLLYSINNVFLSQNKGFAYFQKLEEIKSILSKKLKKEIDLAPKNNLSKTGEKYILSEVIYV